MILRRYHHGKDQNRTDSSSVKSYADLQQFVKTQTMIFGNNVAKPFPFLLSGRPAEIKWHINVDRTEGKPITQELFIKSRASYVTEKELVDIIGFYDAEAGAKNAIHIHFVSRASQAAGHIDDLILGEDFVLRLSRP